MSEIHRDEAYRLGLLVPEYKSSKTEDWNAFDNKIDRISSRLDSKVLSSITSRLDHGKTFSKHRMPKSCVEQFCLDKISDEQELQLLLEIRYAFRIGYMQAKLTTLEREIIGWIDANRKQPWGMVSTFAKEKGLYPSYAYKIRDRAVKKIQIETEKVLIEL